MKRIAALILLLSIAFASNVTMRIFGTHEVNGKFVGGEAILEVDVKPGKGRVFIDTMPLMKVDVQASARLAKEVACEITGINCSKYDFFYTIRSDYPLVGGPSAGAAMCVATLAALTNVSVYSDVAITGTINPDWSVGAVGNVLEKGEAAESSGVKIFLIPVENQVEYRNNESINVTDYFAGMKVIPVKDVLEAYKYMTGHEIEIEWQDVNKVSDRYIDAMKKISEKLITNAKSYSVESEEGEKYLKLAQDYYSEGKYYTAASYAVRASILFNQERLKELYEKEGFDALRKELDETSIDIDRHISMYVKDSKFDCKEDAEIFMIATDRFYDAKDSVLEASKQIYTGDINGGIEKLAYAQVRLVSAYYWYVMTSYTKCGENVTVHLSDFKDAALDAIEDARTTITYSETLYGSDLLLKAKEKLDKAEDAYYEGNYIRAIFLAHEARAEASLSMSLIGVTNETLDSKIEVMRESAQYSLMLAEKTGIAPVLGLSYYEYAGELAKDDKLLSLLFYAYSKELSRLSTEISGAPTTSIYVKEYTFSVETAEKERLARELMILISGMFLGILLVKMLEVRR